jgi:LPS sulfotransferase NodH
VLAEQLRVRHSQVRRAVDAGRRKSFMAFQTHSGTWPRFVLLFEGRSGSTYLMESLDAHPQIVAAHEILFEVKSDGAEAQLDLVRRFFAEDRGQTIRAVGFKTKLTDVLDPPAFARELQAHGARVIHLARHNLVKLAVSVLNAARLRRTIGRSNLHDPTDRPPPEAVDVQALDAILRERSARNRALAEYVDRLGLPVLRLWYEDLLADEAGVIARCCSFLGVPPAAVHGRALKVTPDDLRAALLNFDEVKRFYAGTSYEAMLDEVIVPRSPRARP